MPVDSRMQAQARLVLDRHEGAAAYPAPDQWEDADDLHYLYREYAILVRQIEADRVIQQLRLILDDVGYGDVPADAQEIRSEEVSRGLVRLTVPPVPTLVPDLVARLDEDLWPGIAKPDHKLYVCPHMCPATEPIEVSGSAAPVPAPGVGAGSGGRAPWGGSDGYGVSVSIVDTGLIPGAAARHAWLTGVRGDQEDPYTTDGGGEKVLAPYAGHGTFGARST
jgi:hypothetical protein